MLRLLFKEAVVGLEEYEDVVASLRDLVTKRRASTIRVLDQMSAVGFSLTVAPDLTYSLRSSGSFKLAAVKRIGIGGAVLLYVHDHPADKLNTDVPSAKGGSMCKGKVGAVPALTEPTARASSAMLGVPCTEQETIVRQGAEKLHGTVIHLQHGTDPPSLHCQQKRQWLHLFEIVRSCGNCRLTVQPTLSPPLLCRFSYSHDF